MVKRSSIFNFSKIVLFALALAVPFVYFGDLFQAANAKNKINAFNVARFGDFYKAEEVDMIFVGSSHSYCTFDPEIFDEKFGTSSFQMGLPFQCPDSTYYTILEVLNYQKPKTIVMELYWYVLDGKFVQKQAEMLFQVMENEQLKQDYFNNVYPLNEKAMYFIKPIRFSEDYLAMKNKDFKDYLEKRFNVTEETEKISTTEYYRSKGYVFCDHIINESEFDKTNQYKTHDGKKFNVSKTQKKWIEKVVELCEEKDINLVFVTAPIAPVSMEKIKNYDLIHQKVSELCEEFGIIYIDYNLIQQEENLLVNENFRDDGHLNDSGAQIISNHFADLTKDFLIPTKTLDIK